MDAVRNEKRNKLPSEAQTDVVRLTARTGLSALYRKEMSDHIRSKRFLIILALVWLTSFASLYGALSGIGDAVSEDTEFLFLSLFTTSGSSIPSFLSFMALLGPFVGLKKHIRFYLDVLLFSDDSQGLKKAESLCSASFQPYSVYSNQGRRLKLNKKEETSMNEFEIESVNNDNKEKPPGKKRKSKKWKRGLGIFMVFAMCMAGSGTLSYHIATNASSGTEQSSQEAAPYTTQAQGVSTSREVSDGSIAAIVERVADSVVEVTTEMKQVSPIATEYVTEGAGSGVIITEDGYIVTNHHVIEGASSITVRTADGTEYEAALLSSDEKTDIAVIKIEATGLTCAAFADSSLARVGDSVIAIGNPLGSLGGTVTEGIISALDRQVTIDGKSMTLLQTSAAVSPGNSGGGLFDCNGNLVGIINAKSSGTDVEGLGFAIPSSTVQEVVEELIENGYVTGRPQLGISIIEISDMRDMMTYHTNEQGVYIASVNEENGLQSGDRIISVNGTEITSSSQIQEIIDGCQVGDTVNVTVDRDGGQVNVSVVLTESRPYSDAAQEAA